MRKLLCLCACLLPLELAVAGPLRLESNFVGVTIIEATSGNFSHVFGVNSTELTQQLNLSVFQDFLGAPTERYDVFYSDSTGAFDIDGEYITIQGVYTGNGAGFNITDVFLDFGQGLVAMNTLTAFTPGTGYVSGSELNAIDNNSATATMLGQAGTSSPMSITVGLTNSQTPEPSTFGLAGAALAGVLWRMRRRP